MMSLLIFIHHYFLLSSFKIIQYQKLCTSTQQQYIKIFSKMQPFNCLVQRRFPCSPVRISRPNQFLHNSKPKYPITTTCLPSQQYKNIIPANDNEPSFPLHRKEIKRALHHKTENSQTIPIHKRSQKQLDNTIDQREVRIKPNSFQQRLKGFIQQNHLQQAFDSEQYLRVWFQNLALKEKYKLS